MNDFISHDALPNADQRVECVGMRWIPCAERLPEKYIGEWLCCTDDGQILVLPYDTPGDGSKECVFYRWDDNGYMYETYNVVAWMPLPEPWKGEEC